MLSIKYVHWSLVLALVLIVTLPVYDSQQPLILLFHFQLGTGLYGFVLYLEAGPEMFWGENFCLWPNVLKNQNKKTLGTLDKGDWADCCLLDMSTFRKLPWLEKESTCINPYYHLTVPLAVYSEAGTAHLIVDSSSVLHQSRFKIQLFICTEDL